MEELLKIVIDKTFDNFMIKEVLLDHYHFSSKSFTKIKNNNGIYVNGEAKYATQRVKEGDILQVFIPIETSEDILPEPIPLDIIYEDKYLLIINKSPNMVVHPTKNHYTGTAANGLMYYWQSKGETHRFRPVNRLDKDTSGLFIVAKSQYVHHRLVLQMKEKKLMRKYHAIVQGFIDRYEGAIKQAILKDPDHSIRRIVVDEENPQAKHAITYYKVIERYANHTLLELVLGTGRTHQIRVHMSWLGHPLVGDDIYGGINTQEISRQALHSKELTFIHPISEDTLSFSAPYPDDFLQFFTQNKKNVF